MLPVRKLCRPEYGACCVGLPVGERQRSVACERFGGESKRYVRYDAAIDVYLRSILAL